MAKRDHDGQGCFTHRVKKASDFMYQARLFDWRHGDETQKSYHSLWEHIRGPFAVPKCICTHERMYIHGLSLSPRGMYSGSLSLATISVSPVMAVAAGSSSSRSSRVRSGGAALGPSACAWPRRKQQHLHFHHDNLAWEVYEADLAGCTLCGAMHVCKQGFCPVETSHEGHEICTITGMCVKLLSFSNEEFVDTACYNSSERGRAQLCGDSSGEADPEEDMVEEEYEYNLDGTTSSSWAGPRGKGVSSALSGESASSRRYDANMMGRANGEAMRKRPRLSNPSAVQRGVMQAAAAPPPPAVTRQIQQQKYMMMVQRNSETHARCSVNKKNRYRSWVYHRVMHQPPGCSARSFSAVNHYHNNHSNRDSNAWVAKCAQPSLLAAPASETKALLPSPLPFPSARDSNLLYSSHHRHAPHARDQLDDANRVGTLIQSFVEDVLCSSKWNKSMALEQQKICAKKRSMALKALKGSPPLPAQSSSCGMGISHNTTSASVNNLRVARIDAPYEERQAVCDWCADVIHRHICLVNAMCRGVVTDAKLKTTVIGLLYMMRQGIVVHEIVVLPRLACLDELLPLEAHLGIFFGVKAKCITETENVVKIILRSITKQQLLDAGVARVALKL